jgi:hypothetical protein
MWNHSSACRTQYYPSSAFLAEPCMGLIYFISN